MKLIDVSVPVSSDFPTWPGTRQYQLERRRSLLSGGRESITSSFRMGTHFGTHIDAPLHFSKGGAAVDEIDPDLLVGPCRLYHYTGVKHIGAGDLVKMGVLSGSRVLIKTANSQIIRSSQFHKDYIALLPDGIHYLLDIGVKLLGFDYFSIGAYGKASNEAHLIFLGAGGVIIENVDLSDVEPGEYQLMALPVRMVGLEAAPSRVLLARND